MLPMYWREFMMLFSFPNSTKMLRRISKNSLNLSLRFPFTSNKTVIPKVALSLLYSYLDALLHALAKDQPEQVQAMQDLVAIILEDLIAMKNLPNVIRWDILPILHHMMNHFTALCLNEHTGCSGMKLMTKTLHQAYR